MATEKRLLPSLATIKNLIGLYWTQFVAVIKAKSYIATLTQTSTGAPVATVMENNIGTIVWARSSTGVYTGTLSAAFVANKTAVSISGIPAGSAQIVRTSANVVTISTFNATPAAADSILSSTLVKITVFP